MSRSSYSDIHHQESLLNRPRKEKEARMPTSSIIEFTRPDSTHLGTSSTKVLEWASCTYNLRRGRAFGVKRTLAGSLTVVPAIVARVWPEGIRGMMTWRHPHLPPGKHRGDAFGVPNSMVATKHEGSLRWGT
uniref:Uncharacterized protein n=1 Tax=Cannabis sativa TaxID=3483 RepID=A0A803NSM7_CANSA